MVHDTLELVNRESRLARFAGEASREDDVRDIQDAVVLAFAVDADGPLLGLRVEDRVALDGRLEPDVELHDVGICKIKPLVSSGAAGDRGAERTVLEEVGDHVLGDVDGVGLGEAHVGEVVGKDGVVCGPSVR